MVSQFIVYFLVCFMLVSAVDRASGNHLGLGPEFEKAFTAMGPLALSMAGIMVSCELIGNFLTSTAGHLFRLFGGNAAMSGSLILSMDTGAYPLAHALSPDNPDIANYSAIILASMMGPTIAFNIPFSLGIFKKEDLQYLALGALCAILCIPFGCLAGGLLAGFTLGMLIPNTIPVLLFSLITAAGLWFLPRKMIAAFKAFSTFLLCFLSLMLALAILQELTPVHIIELRPLSEVWITVGTIAIILAGAYPFMHVFTKLLEIPLHVAASFLGIEDEGAAAMIAALVNSIPALTQAADLSPKGKVIVISFTCCSCFAMGDYLGFCASTQPALILPMIAGKLVAAVLSVCACRILIHFRPGLFETGAPLA